jgi:hypothetical protein
MTAQLLELETSEVETWPGVYAAVRTFAGWIVWARPTEPEDCVTSARKLAETTGRTVTVQGLAVHP